MTTITQVDREAAWPYAPGCYASEDKDGWMRGTYDKVVPVIQAFAAHREAAEARARLEGAKAMQEATYKSFTDGLEAAAQICGSLAETTYDDTDAFEAATGCEAAIMRVVKEQRAEQAAALDPAQIAGGGK